MKIAIDVDGVLADFTGAVCARLPGRKPEDFRHYALSKSLSTTERAILECLSREEGFCSGIPWYPGAADFLADLLRRGWDVIALTAPWKSRTWDSERRDWLSFYLPADKVISCPSAQKPFFAADVLIEDRAETLAAWRGRGILFDRPWNRTPAPFAWRVSSYDACMDLLSSFARDLRNA